MGCEQGLWGPGCDVSADAAGENDFSLLRGGGPLALLQGPVAAAAAGGEDAAVGGGALALDAEGSEGEGSPGGAASGDFDGVLQFKFQNE